MILIIALPFFVGLAIVAFMLLSVCVVIPQLAIGTALERRLPGLGAWWHAVVVAVLAAHFTLAATVAADPGSMGALGIWAALTTAPASPALVARRLLRTDRPWRSGAAILGRVIGYGAAAVAGTVVLAAIALSAGLAYEPPHLNAQQTAGTWSDGGGGTLVLTPAGKATAAGVKTFVDDPDSPEPATGECQGAGTWEFTPDTPGLFRKVTVTITGCDLDSWKIYGSYEHPKMFVYVGDPDLGATYVLHRTGPR
ncbi:hypothetical protein ABT160_23280 [Streptomyces sp. NPDC001941]|uniref:hypothetical protein n=1 Tax=Streptomyces sp. NPDC001941 TaxID=3154659 RepID=UPI003316D165